MATSKLYKLLLGSVIFVLILCLTVMTLGLSPEAAAAQAEKKTVERVFGATRYETAFKAADAFLELSETEKFSAVIVASGADFSDALAGSYLAAVKKAPILLYKNSKITALHEYIKDNLLPGGTVYILGGTKAVSAAFENGLTGFSVRRLAGADRFETNLAILKEAGTDSEEILVCTGYTFADSLSASAVGKPILLVNTKTGKLTATQKSYLQSSGAKKIYVIGGLKAISAKLEKQLKTYADIERIGGATRYETSTLVAEEFFTAPKHAVIAYAWNYPDGLCSGLLANQMNSPVLLSAHTNTKTAKAYTGKYGITSGYVLGGTGLLSDRSVCDIFGTVPEAEKPNEPAVYTVAYVLDGGKNAESNPAAYTAGQRLALEAPTKENYVFKGWYLENNFQTKVEQIDPAFTGNITLYAKWNLETLNINGYTTDSMIWSWWYYPQAITAAEDNDNLYWGYTTDEGYCGVARYDKTSGITTKTALKHTIEADDRNSLALTVMKDGRIMCVYSSGHDRDNEVHVRISDKPFDITNFSTDIVLMSAGRTCYGQILQHDGRYYIFYRINNNDWGYRSSPDGQNWSDETIVVSSDMQYYCRFMQTTQPGLVRICMQSDPMAGDSRIRMGFMDLQNGTVYNADGTTVLGSRNVSYDRFDVVVTPPENHVQRMLDVAVTGPASPQILVAVFKNSHTEKDSIYSLYRNGKMTEICHGGAPLSAPSDPLGAAFVGNSKIAAIYCENGSDRVQLYNIAENGVVLTKTVYTEKDGTEPIRNARPIADVNGKAFLWYRGYYSQTEFDTDARLYYLDGSALVGLDPAAFSEAKPENAAAVYQYAVDTYNANIMDSYLKGPFTWDDIQRPHSWIYFTGLMHEAFLSTDFDAFSPEIKKFYDQHIQADGTIPRYIKGELDAAYLGVPIVKLLCSDVLTDEEHTKYNAAVNYIYHQLEKQTIYPQAANLWLHSQNADGTPKTAWTKWNICLDGVFMSQTFLVRLAQAIDAGEAVVVDSSGQTVTSEKLWNDIYGRLVFIMENLRDSETGLLYHGYSVEDGIPSNGFWSRGIGWYSMALLDACEKCPDTEMRSSLISYFSQLMDAVVEAQDPASFLWYNITDGKEELFCKKNTENGTVVIHNLPETSGSAMFSYCLLKGYHCGLLDDESYRTSGLKAFNALVETRLTDEGLQGILNSAHVMTNLNNYQVSGYKVNDGKGAGPLILAANYAY